jgi:hypothetical protein
MVLNNVSFVKSKPKYHFSYFSTSVVWNSITTIQITNILTSNMRKGEVFSSSDDDDNNDDYWGF